MLRTEGRGLESRLCIRSASDTWSYGRQARGCGLEKACHSTGSRDLAGAARDEVYAVDLAWGGN